MKSLQADAFRGHGLSRFPRSAQSRVFGSRYSRRKRIVLDTIRLRRSSAAMQEHIFALRRLSLFSAPKIHYVLHLLTVNQKMSTSTFQYFNPTAIPYCFANAMACFQVLRSSVTSASTASSAAASFFIFASMSELFWYS